MAETPDPQPPGRGKLIVLTVMITTLFWTIVWGGYTLARGRPQQVAFAVQPPPATATPAPTATPVPTTVANTTTATATSQAPATPASRTGFVALDTPREEQTPAASDDATAPVAASPITNTSPASTSAGSLVNINTGTAAELESLPGIGPKTAEAIIAYREEHGPFATIDAITEVKGIGPATLEKLRALITVD